jgi:hypothetical protein
MSSQTRRTQPAAYRLEKNFTLKENFEKLILKIKVISEDIVPALTVYFSKEYLNRQKLKGNWYIGQLWLKTTFLKIQMATSGL